MNTLPSWVHIAAALPLSILAMVAFDQLVSWRERRRAARELELVCACCGKNVREIEAEGGYGYDSPASLQMRIRSFEILRGVAQSVIHDR